MGATSSPRSGQALEELHAFADRAAAGCPRVVANSRAAPYLSVWRGAPAPRFLARGASMPPAAVITPTRDPASRSFVETNLGDRLPGGPWRSARPAAVGRYWTLRLAC